MWNSPSCFINPNNIAGFVREEQQLSDRHAIWSDRAKRAEAQAPAYVRYVDSSAGPLIKQAVEMWNWHAANS